ncbi:MAG: ABC transporter ATP-binding protein [Caldilineaceae bacterium]|nr:ABC transporter ATP-binding protein [Caldilineaceae bacterium]MDE0338520.1 ABC transporter ATP-binding protein [Caldilineaceae bacterium]
MQNDSQPILSVRNLKTNFFTDEGVVRAVDGATFDVHLGQTLGIVGESGCGKSVTALSILRIVPRPGRIVDGEITLRRETENGQSQDVALTSLGENSREMRSIRGAEIALVFQEPMTSLSPVHTIGNQIIGAARLHRQISKQEAREMVIELLGLVGIPRAESAVDSYPMQLSGGMRQRALIALALSCDPRVLIADEPTTALDVTTQAQILDLLRSLQDQKGMAIMLITHNMGVIAEMADQVVVMYLGRVVEEGPVNAVFGESKHPYTQSLLRSIPSIHSTPKVQLPTITGTIPHPYNRPAGCPFHPRCPDVIPGVCDKHEPELHTVGDEHLVSCFLYHPVPEAGS